MRTGSAVAAEFQCPESGGLKSLWRLATAPYAGNLWRQTAVPSWKAGRAMNDQPASKPEFNPLVSLFTNAYENLPTDIPAAQFIASIKGNQHKKRVEEIRERFNRALSRSVPYEKAKRVVDSQKKKLPCVSFAGVLPMRDKNATPQFTGLFQADLDLLRERLSEIRMTLRDDPHVYALFVSPTGEGLPPERSRPSARSTSTGCQPSIAFTNHVNPQWWQQITGCGVKLVKPRSQQHTAQTVQALQPNIWAAMVSSRQLDCQT
jgi:hypothetical protein